MRSRRRVGDGRRLPRPGEHPAGNWLAATVSFLARPRGRRRRHAARGATCRARRGSARPPAWSSRGSAAARSTSASRPGNLRFVDDFPAETIVVRKDDYVARRRCVRSTSSRAGSSPRARACSTRPRRSSLPRRPRSSARICGRRSPTAGGGAPISGDGGLRALRPTTLLPLAAARLRGAGPILVLAGGAARTIWLAGSRLSTLAAVLASGT